MSTFKELIEDIKVFCDEKDREIQRLQDRIDGLLMERKLIRDKFLEGNYESLKWYFN